jgi:hypothetical protein
VARYLIIPASAALVLGRLVLGWGDRLSLLDFSAEWRESRCQDQPHQRSGAAVVDMKLEVVAVPVADADAGTLGRAAGPAPDHKSYGSVASFSDPGNGWLIQEITARLPGR